jgi:superfamily II DNA or RNA helicase
MGSLPLGIYDQVVTEYINGSLSSLDPKTTQHFTEQLDQGDSHATLAHYLKEVISRTLDSLEGQDKLSRQIHLCNRLIELLLEANPKFLRKDMAVKTEGLKLLSILQKYDPPKEQLERPDTPLAFGCLLTGTRLDPSLVSQIKKEILTSDHIEILCSFIKWSGLRIIKDELQEFTLRPNTTLRVITTSYMGATDLKAIEQLAELPKTEIRVSYDTHRTRLHAKAYIFRRETGFGTAYVGSANLSHPAMTDGLEWTVKISQYESPHLWQKVTGTFESYWNDKEFILYKNEDNNRLREALQQEGKNENDNSYICLFDLKPYAFQQEILDRLQAERQIQGRNKHLVVAATGTGKTMIAAFDYRNWCLSQNGNNNNRTRLLYVVHREEILKQGLASFRMVLRNQNFGDMLVGGHKPSSMENLFVSIQSYNSKDLTELDRDFYDYVIIDEFHHAAAPIYQKLLNHIKPKLLLGLTATPERADGIDVLKYFDLHISAEIRLPDAINRKLLCPFQYFGITDSVDLDDVRWQRKGYAIDELENKYTGNDIRTQLIISKVRETLLNVSNARGIGFCVSIEHAKYMAEQFNKYGIPSEALSAETKDEKRRTVQDRLRRKDINFIFVVDLYNEGILRA